jgi:hypothetical protein
MKTKNRLSLILTFAGITGAARVALSEHVQNALFKLGYFWSPCNWDGKPQMQDAEHLYICSACWNPAHITYSNGVIQPTEDCRIFSATSQLADFLEAAKQGLNEERVIEGVKVTITPNSIKLDPSEILARAGQEAKQIKNELFG